MFNLQTFFITKKSLKTFCFQRFFLFYCSFLQYSHSPHGKIGNTQTLSPVMDLYNREILSYSISKNPNFEQTREMLQGLFEKLPKEAKPLLHSDQGWQYQMREFQRMLAEHNVQQSMSRKGNCLDNSCMENFFGRLKTEMFYGETFQSTDEFIRTLKEYLWYYNNERISLKLKGMSPVQYRTHSQI